VSCVGTSIPSLDAMMAAIERCGMEYGGPGWQSLAMTGAVTVLFIAFAAAFVVWMLKEIRS